MNGHVKVIWILTLLCIVISLYQRRRLTRNSKAKISEIPEPLLAATCEQLDDGYKLISVKNGTVRLIKSKIYLFPWLFIPILHVAFNSSVLCNVYGVELKFVSGKVELTTF